MDSFELWLVGARGFGREALAWLEGARVLRKGEAVAARFAGFLDDDPTQAQPYGLADRLAGPAEAARAGERDLYLITLGDSAPRMRYAETIAARGGRFATLIHETVIVGPRCSIGAGTMLCPRAVITTDVVVGEHVLINIAATIGHDARIGDGCTVSSHCDVTGGVVIEEGAMLGSHACVLPGVTIGARSVVGAGSVAIADVAPGATVMGVPARRVLRREG